MTPKEKVMLEIAALVPISDLRASELLALTDYVMGATTPAEDLRDADLDRMTARECFEYLSRGLEGGEAAILKAVAMTRAHERNKRRSSPSGGVSK